MQVADNVKRICGEVIRGLGYDLYEVTYKKETDGMNLTLYIERLDLGVITHDDCEKVSLAVEPILDKFNYPDEQYNLNVSSLGLDWPIKTEKDFARAIGKKIEITLYSKQNGQKDFVGVLKNWNTDSIVLEIENKGKSSEQNFGRKDIANIVPYIEF